MLQQISDAGCAAVSGHGLRSRIPIPVGLPSVKGECHLAGRQHVSAAPVGSRGLATCGIVLVLWDFNDD